MTRALALALMIAAAPAAHAQEAEAPPSDLERGTDLLSEGAQLLFRGLMDEVEPRMRELAEALDKWDWERLEIDDLSNYEAPELMPNGDILIRRKTPLTPPDGTPREAPESLPAEPGAEPGAEIDL